MGSTPDLPRKTPQFGQSAAVRPETLGISTCRVIIGRLSLHLLSSLESLRLGGHFVLGMTFRLCAEQPVVDEVEVSGSRTNSLSRVNVLHPDTSRRFLCLWTSWYASNRTRMVQLNARVFRP